MMRLINDNEQSGESRRKFTNGAELKENID